MERLGLLSVGMVIALTFVQCYLGELLRRDNFFGRDKISNVYVVASCSGSYLSTGKLICKSWTKFQACSTYNDSSSLCSHEYRATGREACWDGKYLETQGSSGSETGYSFNNTNCPNQYFSIPCKVVITSSGTWECQDDNGNSGNQPCDTYEKPKSTC
jgi:hypothetical protein